MLTGKLSRVGQTYVLDAELTRLPHTLLGKFRASSQGLDRLLPELTGEEAPATFGHNKWVPVHRALRYMVLREFTTGVRRTDCLESMGLAKVIYEGLSPSSTVLRNWAEAISSGKWR